MTISHALFSSDSLEWVTPPDVFARISAKYGPFDLDPCATPASAKCKRYFTKLDDGLLQPWAPARVFMNPPYGRAIRHWVAKAAYEAERGAYVVCLIPARTDTSYWHDYCMTGQIEFLRGRISFQRHDGSTGRAPFPSAIVAFGLC